jgi:hypothetical protein
VIFVLVFVALFNKHALENGKNHNVLFACILQEFESAVGVMAVKEKKSGSLSSFDLCVDVKVLDPLNTKLAINPSLLGVAKPV